MWFFLHLLILYCTAKRDIKPKMCITMIFMTFDDFLTFDNIQKKVNWGFSSSSYRKSMIERAFESWNNVLLEKKNFTENFWFLFTYSYSTVMHNDKKIFRSFSSKNEQKCRFLKIEKCISILNIFMTYDRNVPNDTAFESWETALFEKKIEILKK